MERIHFVDTKANFIDISWNEIKENEIVFLKGNKLNYPVAYGVFKVINKEKRELRNLKGISFLHYAEDLIIPTFK
jgi:predicted ribosome-associated RNA-binding protein Tma20